MPVRIKTADHEANLIAANRGCDYPKAILNEIQPDKRIGDLHQSSLDNELPPVLIANNNGFVNAIVEAFNQHHHLVIRPDDIWLAILTQFKCYVTAHGEELTSHFGTQLDPQMLRVSYHGADRYSVDFADFASKISILIDKSITDPELRRWIIPSFSTTTQNDVVVFFIVMVGMLQRYFQNTCDLWCSIPSVTLLGEKTDYEIILARLEKLEQYGDEPSEFMRLLRPILTRFIRSFDEPDSQEVIGFWRDICSVQAASGQQSYNGWISAFCFWNSKGQRQLSPQSHLRERYRSKSHGFLCLDGVYYHEIDPDKTPPGYATLPMRVNDHGTIINAEMLSGSVGISCTSSGRVSTGPGGDIGIDTMQPHSAWFIYDQEPEDDRARDMLSPSPDSIAKIDLLVKELNSPENELNSLKDELKSLEDEMNSSEDESNYQEDGTGGVTK
ncbi:hypothetical protein CHU98_g758 [Xylaria longipes]|nr:hypothetical protein CHU98_g758 [Xylaria longipes]